MLYFTERNYFVLKSEIIISLVLFFVIFSPLVANAQTYRIYVDEMPKKWQPNFGNVLYEATKYWEDRMGVSFYQVNYPDQSDFVVQWASVVIDNRLGYYTTNTNNDYGKPFVAITLGYMDDPKITKWQYRKFHLVDPEYVKLITIHEIGHAIGLGHSNDPDDIMYPSIYDYDNWVRLHSSEPEVGQPNEGGYIGLGVTSTDENEIINQFLNEEKEYENSAYEAKSYYENLIFNDLTDGITRAEKSLSALHYESSDAQKKIQQAWQARGQAVASKNHAEKKFGDGLDYLNNGEYKTAYNTLKTIDPDAESIGNSLKWISSAIKDAKKMEQEYQAQVTQKKEIEKFCFLFWCW